MKETTWPWLRDRVKAMGWTCFVVFPIVTVLLVAGCEDGATSVPAVVLPSHDFGDNDPDLYVAMGDSITKGIGVAPYPAMLADLILKTVINEGISGEHAYEGAARVGAMLMQYKPGYLLILYGANDIVHRESTEDIVEDLRQIVNAARDVKAVPVLATLTPMVRSHRGFQGPVLALNARIRSLAVAEDILLVDLEAVFDSFDDDEDPYDLDEDDLLQRDGLHPNETGNLEIALAFEAGLVRYEPMFPGTHLRRETPPQSR
ncbi:MAG: SGNH/GDSL hydrolase family protein [Verrucomicrobia bacterium]|nr:SGNH/GDSL hydrolase family protein [Verrucomicrobiota bacterium]MBT7066097.1 SGNH/GDSL hydrolase family protein [Verrucomicrobiota bacterium]MBT7700307.1 SGNH/GDSL hydrolase family protein [Verrucomicrobiota bacterium]